MKKTTTITIIIFIISLAFLTNSCLEDNKGNPVKPKVVGGWTFQQTWVSYDLKGLFLSNSDEIWVTGNGGAVLKSTNGGVVWERINVPVNSNFPNIYFYEVELTVQDTIRFKDTIIVDNKPVEIDTFSVENRIVNRQFSWLFGCVRIIVAVDNTRKADVGSILRSYDNGSSWVEAVNGKLSEGDIWASVTSSTYCFGEYKVINDSTICAVGGINFGTPGESIGLIMYTNNNGADWEARVTGGEAYEKFNGVDFVSDLIGFAVGHNGIVFRTDDAGYYWSEVSPIEYDNGDSTVTVTSKFNKIHFVNSNTGFIVGGGSTILKTIDGGVTWQPVFDPADYPGDDFSNLEFNDFNFIDENTGWVVGNNGIVFRTGNGGDTWSIVDSYTQVDLYNVHLIDADNVFVVGGGGTVMRYRK